MTRKQTRGRKGAILGFVVAATILLCMLGAGIFALLMAFGSGYQMQNAVEAGALGVGQKVLTLTDTASGHKGQFSELAYKGDFTLGNVNRAAAKSILIAANEADMRKKGYNTGASARHKDQVVADARKIADSLAKQVTQDAHAKLDGEFKTFANSNSLRMLMPNAQVKPNGLNWAYLDAGAESNIIINKNVLPKSQRNAVATKTKGDKEYLRGYTNQIGGARLIPFRQGERTALISGTDFSAGARPQSGDIPNAWQVKGTAQSRVGSWLNNVAMVQTNPREKFDLRMHNGWVRIVLKANTVKWKFFEAEIESRKYPFRPGTERANFPIPVGGFCTSTAYVGNEDIGFNLWDIMNPSMGGGNQDVFVELFERIREMRPEADDEQIKSLLRNTIVLPTAQDQTFYVHLNGDNNLTVSRSIDPWIITRLLERIQPDGSSKKFEEEWPTPDYPNFATAVFEGECPLQGTWANLYGTFQWQPGTGYDGCLGQLELARTTEVTVVGGCIPPVP